MVVAGGGLYFLTRLPPPGSAVPARGDSESVPAPPSRAGDGADAVDGVDGTLPRNRRAVVPPRTPAPAPAATEPVTGTLRIDSDVPGAQVFIDRNFVGNAPVTVRDLTPGAHRLNVDAPGYDGVLQMIEVEPGSRELVVPLRAVRLDASIAVVHKHRIGSCRGQLTATAAGIRYVADQGDDSFEARLSDVEQFEVDYLEKNLRVRVGGRQYDFTDPQGNADSLFTFHRDVDRARTRLYSGDPPEE